MVEANNDAYQKLKELKPDIVFNFAEGLNGVNRESHIPAMLEMLEIPYSGSDALTLGICLDKSRAKEILTYHKIPNAKFLVANQMEDISNTNFDFPLIVKPISEGSSKGIFSSSFVKNTKENNFDVFECPAKLNSKLEEKIKETILQTYNVLGCKDWSRIDVRLDKNGIPNIIEINPLPGIMPDPNENSSFPKAARAAGMNYNQMIQRVLYSAAKRYNLA